MTEQFQAIEITRIMQMIPHRYPFLLVDRMLETNGDESAIGLKNVTINEPFFQGHFPGNPVMPGVLIIEAMAQVSGLTVIHHLGKEAEGKTVYFLSINGAKFRKLVVPGDSLYIHVQKIQNRKNIWKFYCEAKVDGHICAEATVAAMLADV
jgi:3-hydroxyacyl-[acyl-carrier-protein] dehydratase